MLSQHFAMIRPAFWSVSRNRRIFTTGVANAISRGLSILSSFVIIGMAVPYLGAERYGLWVAATAFVAMFSFADLGLGNGIINHVARLHGTNDDRAVRQAVSSAIAVLGGLCVLFLFLFA